MPTRSAFAMTKHIGGITEYRASEGKMVDLQYRGLVEQTINDILGGIRSTGSYVGTSRLKELIKRTIFIRDSEQENTVYTKIYL